MRVIKPNGGFTLLELILVMGVLAMLAAITAPRLSGFSKGREYQGEWNRFVSVLRYARCEAISRSTPVEIRFDGATGAYRLVGGYWFEPLPSYATEHPLGKGLSFEFADAAQDQEGGVSIVFQPDGSVDAASPRQIQLVEDGGVFEKTVELDPVLGYRPQTQSYQWDETRQ